MFISSYTTIYFFVKIFFSNVYVSVNTIFECSYLSFGSEIYHSLSTCAAGGMEGISFKMCTGADRGRGLSRLICTYALTISLFMFCFMVSCFICRNLPLPSFKKGVFAGKIWVFLLLLLNVIALAISQLKVKTFVRTVTITVAVLLEQLFFTFA